MTKLAMALKERTEGRRQREVAEELGVPQSLLSMVLSGERRISPRLARRIAEWDKGLREEAIEYLLTDPDSDAAAG